MKAIGNGRQPIFRFIRRLPSARDLSNALCNGQVSDCSLTKHKYALEKRSDRMYKMLHTAYVRRSGEMALYQRLRACASLHNSLFSEAITVYSCDQVNRKRAGASGF